jgi:hypothetical protein
MNPSGVDFTPIGPGKPLTVEIVHVYTGKYPSTIFGPSPMLVTSAIKNLDAAGASSEAVNYLVNKVAKRTDFIAPQADKQGTKLVCYVPAVTAVSTTVTLNLVFENFPDSAFQEIESVFNSAGGIPLFLSASPYIIGGGMVLKLIQDVGDAIFNGKPNYTPTVVINFTDIGAPTTAGYLVLFKSQDDPHAAYGTFTFDPQKGLIDPKTNAPYNGDAPYLVIAIDGVQRDALKNFSPLAASADLLSTFFNIKDGGVVPVGDIVNVLKSASDVTYGKQVLATKAEIKTAQAAGKDTKALQQQLDSYVANIQDPDLAALFKSN